MKYKAIETSGLFAVLEIVDQNGFIKRTAKGGVFINAELTDTEQIPFTYEGGIDFFLEKEVKSFAPYAWVDEKKTQIGYEISFTKYF